MKVLVDISSLGLGVLHPEWRGGGFRADERLLEELAATKGCELAFCTNHSSVTSTAARQYVLANPALARYPFIGAAGSRNSLLRRGMGQAYRIARKVYPFGPLPSALRSGGELIDRRLNRQVTDTIDGADIFHSTQVALPPRSRSRSPQRFLTIYDLRYRLFPELYDERSIKVGEATLDSVGPEDWVITSSEASKRDLIHAGVAEPERVFVVPLAADRERFHRVEDAETIRLVRERYGIGERPYVLSVSSIDVRKNMDHAVRAFARLAREAALRDVVFVIAGAPGSGSQRMAAALGEASEVRDRILQIGFVQDEHLAALYSGASLFVYPSLYEGFGLPPLEAMQCGTPVVTSNSSSLPEVVGDAGCLVPPHDIDALCSAIEEILTDSSLREALARRALDRAARFSWQRTAQGILEAYRAALQ